MDIKFINVLLLGFGFMFVFTAFQTTGNIQKVVLDSIHQDDPTFTGDGYRSLAILYAVFAICNWLAPSALSIIGPRAAMLLGSATYCLYMLVFIWPRTWMLYAASALVGVGAAVTWTGQGTYLSKCSDPSTISRNSGLFWAMLQASMFFGNIFVFFQFQGQTHIGQATRQLVFTVLIGVGILGLAFLATLKNTKHFEAIDSADQQNAEGEEDSLMTTAVREFKAAIRLFTTRDMLLLSLTFLYTGIVLSFFSGVYSSSIGFTLAFGESAKQLVGLSGICIGLGEIVGGVTFGLLGKKTIRFGRDPIVIMGFIVHIAAFLLAYMNLPESAPLGDTKAISYFDPPLASVALFCAFLLGLGDACFNTQVYSMLGGVFASQSTAAFALFKFVQSVGAAASFVYSSYCGLKTHMVILVVSATIGTISFCVVERANKRKQREIEAMEDKLEK